MDSYVTIDKIVRQALIAMGEQSLHKYPRCLQFAMECFKDFQMDSAQDVKTVRLTMNDVKQIELPLDFVDWVKVGIVCGDRIKIMGVCDTLPILTVRDDCGVLQPYTADIPANVIPNNWISYGGYSFFGFNEVNEWGELLGAVYGIGGGYTDVGYFRVLRNQGDHGVLQFNSDVNTTDVYLEYISNGFDPKAESIVNSYAEKCIQFYIHWRVSQHKNGAASRDAQAWERQYYNELRKSRIRISGLDVRQVLELSRKHYAQAPKF